MENEQLRREAAMKRIPVSQAVEDIKVRMVIVAVVVVVVFMVYSARHLMGSRLIESASYDNQILLVQSYLNSAQNTLAN